MSKAYRMVSFQAELTPLPVGLTPSKKPGGGYTLFVMASRSGATVEVAAIDEKF